MSSLSRRSRWNTEEPGSVRCDKNFTIDNDNDNKDNDNEDNDNDHDKYIEEPGNVRYNFQYQHQYYQSSLKISFFYLGQDPHIYFPKNAGLDIWQAFPVVAICCF